MPARRSLGVGGRYLSSVAEQTAQEDAIYWSIKGEGTEGEQGFLSGKGLTMDNRNIASLTRKRIFSHGHGESRT